MVVKPDLIHIGDLLGGESGRNTSEARSDAMDLSDGRFCSNERQSGGDLRQSSLAVHCIGGLEGQNEIDDSDKEVTF